MKNQNSHFLQQIQLFALVFISVVFLFQNAQGQKRKPKPAANKKPVSTVKNQLVSAAKKETYSLQIINKSDFSIKAISLRKSTKTNSGKWGVNQFSDSVLKPGKSFTLTEIPSGEYDVKMLKSTDDSGCNIRTLKLNNNISRIITNACWNQTKIEVPKEFTKIHQAIVTGKPFEFNEANMLFLGGMANYVFEICELPDNYADRLTLGKFVISSGLLAGMGNSYADPNFPKQMSGAVIFASGYKAVESIGCTDTTKLLSANIVKVVKSNAEDGDGKVSKFVKTCSPYFSESQCKCLADAGRAVIPNIHQESYDRSVFQRIINGNPFVGFQIIAQCNIVRY